MALRGDAVYVVDDPARPRRRQLRDVECDAGSLDVVRRKRPPAGRSTRTDRLHRKWGAWVVMRRSGMTYQEIADATGYSLCAVHNGVRKGEVLAREALRRRQAAHGV
jgi:hypothetical protein